jgi:hypothetical protein
MIGGFARSASRPDPFEDTQPDGGCQPFRPMIRSDRAEELNCEWDAKAQEWVCDDPAIIRPGKPNPADRPQQPGGWS